MQLSGTSFAAPSSRRRRRRSGRRTRRGLPTRSRARSCSRPRSEPIANRAVGVGGVNIASARHVDVGPAEPERLPRPLSHNRGRRDDGVQRDGLAVPRRSPARRGTRQPGLTQRGLTRPGRASPGATRHGPTQPGRPPPGARSPGATRPGRTPPGATQPGPTASSSNARTASTSPHPQRAPIKGPASRVQRRIPRSRGFTPALTLPGEVAVR